MNLWSSKGCAKWHTALDLYPEIVKNQQVRGLEEVDSWYRTEFPALLTARAPVFVTRDELERVMQWKMKRGVWRERNRLLVAGNDRGEVEQTAREAFAAVPDPRQPIAFLSRLAGVGPATASAVLAAFRPDVYPFFDELVAVQIPDLGPVAFTAPYYQRYAAKLRERTERLNKTCTHQAWTAQEMSQALWAASGGKVANEVH
ncbi:MAG: hypothetical protein WCF84_07835 [Anaerolineae bacterium]